MARLLRTSDTDACPGALRLHPAADGLVARVRLVGGMLTGGRLRALRVLAQELGDGCLELTSRANLQIRGLQAEGAEILAARLRDAGLLPSLTHDPVRNIAAPPLAGPGLRALVARLDDAILADPGLPRLPGKFLFAIGVVPIASDVAAVPAGDRFAIRFAGHDTGLRVAADRVVSTMVAAAHAFLAEREAQRGDGPAVWRLRELDDGPARVTGRLGLVTEPVAVAAPVPAVEPGGLLGVLEQPDGGYAAGALVPLGRLTPVPMEVLEAADQLVVTPWRGVIVADLSRSAAAAWTERLIAAGLATAADSRWVGVTACAGLPGCARSRADVRADAATASRFVDGLPVHWVGCERGCGSPMGRHVRVEATTDGYRVDDAPVREEQELGDLVAAARTA
ncbi:precorrin-3B synthase [Actinoplanes sp. NBRC 101535]|uniref:precorrin-3B synthase n=1 Tax=Actinoplanes sp. NBRC 101535 TaxID=3032196 RepID=UPI0024A5EE08|nr:precorrin-3B synthase [Actinoplanes sp. NBRC 101535]GLY05593.1 precorrin-3B synthase [Actinoplanes sp. NBRC 101535]